MSSPLHLGLLCTSRQGLRGHRPRAQLPQRHLRLGAQDHRHGRWWPQPRLIPQAGGPDVQRAGAAERILLGAGSTSTLYRLTTIAQVPATRPPRFPVACGVDLRPINALSEEGERDRRREAYGRSHRPPRPRTSACPLRTPSAHLPLTAPPHSPNPPSIHRQSSSARARRAQTRCFYCCAVAFQPHASHGSCPRTAGTSTATTSSVASTRCFAAGRR